MDSFTPADGPWALCTYVVSDDKYSQGTLTDVHKCCVNICDDLRDSCLDTCRFSPENVNARCIEDCSDIHTSCDTYCGLIGEGRYFESASSIKKAGVEAGCGNGYTVPLDRSCMTTNKKIMIGKCLSDCPKTVDGIPVDCGRYCDYAHDLLMKAPLIVLDMEAGEGIDVQGTDYSTGSNTDMWWWVVVWVSVACFIIAVKTAMNTMR